MKTKTQISFVVIAKLISAFVFATWIVQSLYSLNPKFQASSHLLWLCSPVCVGPGRKPCRQIFSRRGSYINNQRTGSPVKTGVYRGIHFFLIFALKHRSSVPVRTASVRRFKRVPTIYVLSKNNTIIFTAVKYYCILYWRIIVMKRHATNGLGCNTLHKLLVKLTVTSILPNSPYSLTIFHKYSHKETYNMKIAIHVL